MIYIRLFHGRTDLSQDMNDWGTDGPIFGPYNYVHTTYNSFVRLGWQDGICDELHICGPDLLCYDGVYYGDWSVFGEEVLKEDSFEITAFEQSKANLPPK